MILLTGSAIDPHREVAGGSDAAAIWGIFIPLRSIPIPHIALVWQEVDCQQESLLSSSPYGWLSSIFCSESWMPCDFCFLMVRYQWQSHFRCRFALSLRAGNSQFDCRKLSLCAAGNNNKRRNAILSVPSGQKSKKCTEKSG